MGKSRSSAPPVVDPNQLIQQDAAANRITQFSPYGNLLFGSVGDQGQFVQGQVPEGSSAAAFTQETPFQSQLRSQQENLGLGLATEAGEQFANIAEQTPYDFTQGLPDYTFQDATNLPAFQSQLPGAGTGATSLNVDALPAMQSSVTGADPLQRSLDTTGLPTLPTDFAATRQNVSNTVYQRQLGLLEPDFTAQRQQLEQNLADRGLPLGGEAYSSALDRLDRSQGEQKQRLAQQADIMGGQEASRLFGQASQARGQMFGEAGQQASLQNQAIQQELSNRLEQANLANQARGQGFQERAAQGEFGLAGQQQAFGQQAANVAQQNQARQQAVADQMRANELQNQQRQAQLNERMGLRGQQFNELAALLGGPQIQQPTFFAPSAVNTLGANQLAQQGAMNAYNQGMANYGSGMGGLFDLAGSLGSAYLLR